MAESHAGLQVPVSMQSEKECEEVRTIAERRPLRPSGTSTRPCRWAHADWLQHLHIY
jgi:hypothetical protein